MSRSDQFQKLDNMLHLLPKPSLERHKKEQIQQTLSDFYVNLDKKPRKHALLKRLSVGFVGIVALSLFSFMIVISQHSHEKMRHHVDNQIAKTGAKNSIMQKKAPIINNHNKWDIASRVRYLQGTITDLTASSGSVIGVKVKEDIQYGSDADPLEQIIDLPSEKNEYRLIDEYVEGTNPYKVGDEIIMEIAQYTKTAKGDNPFWGGKILYYFHNGKFYDLNGSIANVNFSSKVSIKDGNLTIAKDLDSGYQQFADNGNMVFLNKQLSFHLKNLGGGASNFTYEISKSNDGGVSWKVQGTIHLSSVGGISFIDENTGFLVNNSPAYEVTPTLQVTHNGGKDWTLQQLPIPEQYKNYFRRARYPVFFSKSVGVLPVYGFYNNGSNAYLYMLITEDGGNSWTSIMKKQSGDLTWIINNDDSITITYQSQRKITIKEN